MLVNAVILRICWQESDQLRSMGYIDLWLLCVYVKTFWLLFILFIPISCFKFTFSRKATMGCTLLYVSLKLLLMLSMFQCLFIISFIFGNTGLYVTKNGIYIWVYNVLKAIIYLRDQLSQFFSYSQFIVAIYRYNN